MTDYTKTVLPKMNRDEVDVLKEELNNQLEYIAKLETECKELQERLREAELALKSIRQSADDEQHKVELRYRDGMIEGLKYAIRCNGVSGGEVNQ